MKRTFEMIETREDWDVIVCGGGPAGCAAAAAAARMGAKTLLLEATGALGGMGTMGLVPAWCPFSDQEKMIYRSIAKEVFDALKADMPYVPSARLDWVPIDSEKLKGIYDRLVVDSGAVCLFFSQVCGAEAEDGRIRRILVCQNGDLKIYQAKTYIDCTGEGILSRKAGAQMVTEETVRQPATHCFALGNVDLFAFQHGPNMHGSKAESPIHAIVASGKYPHIQDTHICCNVVGQGTVGFNAGHLWEADPDVPEQISRAMAEGRAAAREYRDALAEFHPTAFGNAHLASTAPLMGIRESRQVLGDYVLTADDYCKRRSFPDEICRNSYYVDVHYSKEEAALIAQGKKEAVGRPERYGPGESYGIPYRCLTPVGFSNLLVAGKIISCDRMAQGSARVMPVCLCTGEAAGVAAVLADGGNVHEISTEKLRERLKENGAYLPDAE